MLSMIVVVVLFCEILWAFSGVTSSRHIRLIAIMRFGTLGLASARMCDSRRMSLVNRLLALGVFRLAPIQGRGRCKGLTTFSGLCRGFNALLGGFLGLLLLGDSISMSGRCLHLLLLQQSQSLLQAHGLRLVLVTPGLLR